ncbi:MAG TPA: NAD(P)-dependent oxidoreductase [Geminicoccaceae bacterium]
MDQTIGFIGLGLMGGAATRRLVERGHRVIGYDIVEDKVRRAAGHGVEGAASPAEVARAARLVHICVMTRDDLETAVFGHEGIASGGGPDKVLIDHSTTEVGVTRAFAERLMESCGMAWADAPVSGGPPAAAAGSLAIMVGAADDVFARVEDELRDLGVVTHMGPVGAGQVTKMVNQVLVLNNYCILAEALALAEAGGVDAAKIPAALASGHAGSNMLKNLYPRILARDFDPAGYAFQVLKDLDMVQGLARDLKVPTPMSAQATSLFRILNAKGHGQLDGLAIFKLYDKDEHV